MSSPLHTSGHSNEPTGVEYSHGEKEVAFAVEMVDAGSDSDITSDVNPGELTFEEDTAGGMGRHLGVFSCTMLNIGAIIGTGIFSTPSSILGSVGSVGASLMLWVLGFALSFCGLFVWLEFGTMFPRSGGEKVYLEAAYRRPKHLVTVVFAVNAVILNFSSGSCIVFAEKYVFDAHLYLLLVIIPISILISAGHSADLWVVRGIAIGAICFVILLHGFTPRLGVYVINVLTLFKTVVLLLIVVTGWIVLSGKTQVKDPHVNFRHAFAGSSHSGHDYATAMFEVLYAYSGWQNANYVLNEVRDPVRTLKIAGPLGLGITTTLYISANIAYFATSSKTAILESGTTVASLFFENVFGVQAQRALTVFVALSQLQSIFNVAYSASRVNQELAKEGIPLPFGNRLWATNWPTQRAPFPGLVVHLIATVIVIVAPPLSIAYPFILDVAGYPVQIINFFVILGLFYLRWKKPRLPRPFRVWLPLAFFFLLVEAFLLIFPFLRPANGVGDTPPLPYYLFCLVGIAVMMFGVLYWAIWKLMLPYVFKFRLVPRKEVLEDGTVVTLFSREKVE
ncbi:amino acid transporter [Russula ochroleuca]|uniref:Amino acid transporter n=1 Tax=Russula ochroleuca TaxID=152965 RepID=A0A9P5JWY8_9AGAM|nr:amino acid transporter [Russula ochroleuca]